ncbi:alkene reductase [Phenylobacterium sp.]|uniref:oxidoreductase n=1 Tax=Phenylobacterium sp. TaxID=1871053 RepID=UPI003BAC106E
MSFKLLDPFRLHGLSLSSRVVVAPVIHPQADKDEVLTPYMVDYYRRRASAGLIVTGGAWVSPEAIGCADMPGVYTEAQTSGWRAVAEAVHAAGGKVFLQLAHTGAISHPDHFGGALPFAPSALDPRARSITPTGYQPTVTPRAMTLEDIGRTIEHYRAAARNAKRAGFDGVEIHGAHAFLIPAFLSSATNIRTDQYGGSPENRARFLLELVAAVVEVWGPGRVGLKLSPAAAAGRLQPNADTEPTYRHLLGCLNACRLAYLRVEGSKTTIEGSAAETFRNMARWSRPLYSGVLIAGGGYSLEDGEAVLQCGDADLIALGAPFAEDPDLIERVREHGSARRMTPVD